MVASRSASRGRSPSESHTPPAARRASSPPQAESRSPRRERSASRSSSFSDRRRAYTPSPSRSPVAREQRNGHSYRYRSRSPSRDGRKPYRDRTRSPSRSPVRGRRPQSSKIVVEKLTKNVTEAHLKEIFGSYGRIQSIDLPMNRQFMSNRGTAYIVYESALGSESAIAHMHEAQLDGAVITVSIVLPRRAFSRSPPPIKSYKPGPPPSQRFGAPRGPPSARYRSPPPRRGGHGGRPVDWDDPRRNGRDYTRSPSPPRRRERSVSDSRSRSPSRTPVRRRAAPARSPPRRRRRSPSYSSYSTVSRSKSRTPSRTRYGNKR